MVRLKKIFSIICIMALMFETGQAQQLPASPSVSQTPQNEDSAIERIKGTLPFYGIDYENLPRSGSAMFSKRDLQRLYSAIKGSLISSDEIGSTTSGDQPIRVAPAFYLNSVVFVSEENWAIWINNKKIRIQDINPNLTINYVTRDKVEIMWETKDLDIISPNWRAKLELGQKGRDADSGYISKKHNIFVPLDASYVRFTLMPNQTFVSRDMRIAEGFVPETLINIQAADENFTGNNITAPNNNVPPNSNTETPLPAGQQIKIN